MNKKEFIINLQEKINGYEKTITHTELFLEMYKEQVIEIKKILYQAKEIENERS